MTASAQALGSRLAWEGKGPAGLGGEGTRGALCKVWLQLELPHQGLQASFKFPLEPAQDSRRLP